MARTAGTEELLVAAARWKERCLLADGSVFSDDVLWTSAHVAELVEHFIDKPDDGKRVFIDKLHDQLAPASADARRLAAEMLWVMFLFPNNLLLSTKAATVRTVWEWSGRQLGPEHPQFEAMGKGIGSGGQGYNRYLPDELEFFIRLLEDWKSRSKDELLRLATDPWEFAAWIDQIHGADRRQFRHMLLHLLFPDTFERVSSGANKLAIDLAFADAIALDQGAEEEAGQSLLARDRRLLHIRQELERQSSGAAVDFYWGEHLARWRPEIAVRPKEDEQDRRAGRVKEPTPGPAVDDGVISVLAAYEEPPLNAIADAIASRGLRMDARTLRRYHLALRSRGFVILSGISGTGKTWLAEEYAHAVGAKPLVVPVAPNWTTNEDLLGYSDPFSKEYRDTAFSRFLREAAVEHRTAGRGARPFHLILDEMNLARVEYYFARFLSAMELRMRGGEARIELGPTDSVPLPPNLRFIGTVNVDETTHGFADKVYDRAQLIEIPAPRQGIDEHLTGAPYKDLVLEVWDAVRDVAPFAFRVLDDIGRYVESAKGMDVPWEELLDELILQKVLPKLKGTEPRIGDALQRLEVITTNTFPLSAEKVRRMRSGFQEHGFASYF